MKKVSTAATKQSRNFSRQKLTIGLDLGDRSSWYGVLDEAGGIVFEQKLSTTPKSMKDYSAHRECGWKGGDSGDSPQRKTLSNEKTNAPT